MAGFALSTASNRARGAAFGLAAVSMIVASYGVSSSASAQEPIAPACRNAGSELAQLRCSTALSKKVTAAYNARTKAAEARIANSQKVSEAALTSKACFDTVSQDILLAKKTGPLTPAQKSAFRARIADCDKT